MSSAKTTRVKGVFLSLMTVLIVFVGVLLPTGKAHAADITVNERVSAFIEMMQNKQEGEDGDLQITADELQFLGIFLSNYYTPFYTELGVNASKQDMEETQEAMQQVLEDVLSFSPELSKTLVNVVLNQIMENSQPLQWGFSTEEVLYSGVANTGGSSSSSSTTSNPGNKTQIELLKAEIAKAQSEGRVGDVSKLEAELTKLLAGTSSSGSSSSNTGNAIPDASITSSSSSGTKSSVKIDVVDANVEAPNVITFVEMLGRTWQLFKYRVAGNVPIPSEVDETLKKALEGKYKYAHLVIPGHESTPVFSMSLDVNDEATPAQVAALNGLLSVGALKNTLASSILDVRVDETKNQQVSELVLSNGVDSIAEFAHLYSSQLYISPFGDIINVGRGHQVVLVPGALNPYTWKNVDAKGDDTQVMGAGQGANYFTMTALKNGDFSSISKGSYNGVENAVSPFKALGDTFETKLLDAKMYSNNTGITASEAVGLLAPASGQDYNTWGNDRMFDEFFGGNATDVVKQIYEITVDQYPHSSYIYTRSVNYDGGKAGKIFGISKGKDTSKIPLMTNVVRFDDKQQHIESGEKINMISINAGSGLNSTFASSAPTNPFFQQNLTIGENIKAPSSPYENMGQLDAISLYVTYAVAGIYEPTLKAETIGKLGYRVNIETLPEIQASNVDTLELNAGALDDQILRDIRHWTWYLLHPTDGLRYVTTLMSNKVASFMMGWHSDMVGTDGIGIMPGSTRYTGFSGYVTTPSLSDIEWLDSLTNFYHDILIYIIIGVAALMGLYAITSVLTVQQAIAGAILFAVLAWVPAPLINFVIDTSNSVSSKLYNSKFSYWSLLQHQSYTSLMDKAVNEDSYEDYLATLHELNMDLASSTPTVAKNKDNMGGNSIIVKWQAPKKMSSLNLNSEMGKTGEESLFRDNGLLGANMNAMIRKTFSGETFTGNPEDVYLYRSYTDLGNWSRYIYKAYSEDGNNFRSSLSSNVSEVFSPSLTNSMANKTEDNLDTLRRGLQSPMLGQFDNSVSVTSFLMSPIYTDAYASQAGHVSEADLSTLFGIDQRLFAFDMGDFTQASKKPEGYFCDKVIERADSSEGFEECGGYESADIGSLAAYGLYSESPFFFFSWNLYDQGMSPAIGNQTNGGFKDLLLGGENGTYFYNNTTNEEIVDVATANGGMKDYLNMRYLFKYVMPYLRMGNDVVKEYFDLYGMRIYKGISLQEGQQGKYDDDPVLKQQYWHNLNVTRLYNMYSPWVDLLDSSKYGESETIQFMGENKTIENPLDPFNYPKDRPMVFSESEMRQFGLEEYQLTSVEKKIQEIERETQKDYVNLLNYYNYHDSVINTAAAMHATFNFNSAFSHSGLGQGIQLYPQGYELNNFTYDAFMRLILANSTGYDVTQSVETDYYTDLVQQSSITTAILLLANDVVAVYLLPGLKLFFVVGIFLASIIMLFASAIRVEENIVKNAFKSLVFPLVKYLAATIGFAFLISLFMSGGATGVTGEEGVTIKFGDPALTLLILLVINVIMAYIYFKIVWSVLKDLKKYTVASVKSVGGVFSGIGASIAGSVSGESESSGGGGVGQKSRGLGSSAMSATAGAAGAAAAMRSRKKMQNSKNPNFTAQDKYRDKAQEQAERRKKKGFVRRKVDESGWKERINGSVQEGYGHIQRAVGEANIRMSRGRWGHNLKTKGTQRVDDGKGRQQRGLDKASSVQTRKDIRRNAFKQESQQRKEDRRKSREQRQEERQQRRQKSKKDK